MNSNGKNFFWHGYIGHLAVTTKSQYILSSILTSAYIADICQKVIKLKQQTDPRKFNHPARGTKGWKKLYAKRSTVERINGDLKENMKLNQTTHYKAEVVVVELLLIQLAYNAKRYAVQRLNHKKMRKEAAA